MPWSGAGIYNLPPAFTPEVNGTVIDATRYNGTTSDIATGITVAIAKDGQNVPTANLPMGGFKHTGAADANGTGQYIAFNQATTIGSLTITTLTTTTNVAGLGVVGTPSYTFTGDLNTGLWSPGADIAALSAGGAGILRVGTGGARITHATLPLLDFYVTTTRTATVNTDASNFSIGSITNIPVTLYTNNTSRVGISNTGTININTPTSGKSLVVAQISGSQAIHAVASINGGPVFTHTENTSNTASSDALNITTVAGTSAGDPYHRFDIGASIFWSIGADNSDSDTFKIDSGSSLTTATNRFNVTTDGRVYGNALHNNAGAVTGTTNQYIASGTYQPAPTGVTNITSVSAASAVCGKWLRVGNTVHCGTAFDVDPVAGGSTTFRFSLPPCGGTLAAPESLSGTGVCIGNATSPMFGRVYADVANNQAAIDFVAGTDLVSRRWSLTFTYEVI